MQHKSDADAGVAVQQHKLHDCMLYSPVNVTEADDFRTTSMLFSAGCCSMASLSLTTSSTMFCTHICRGGQAQIGY